MKKIACFIKENIYILFLLLIVLVIINTNLKQGTILSGWDNLHPEFNFLLNIKRSIFAVWQEYQGLGLLGGMGHAADLPREIFIWILSSLISQNNLRYSYHFLMLFLGSLGIYFLIKDIILYNFKNKNSAGFIGAIFYLFNLTTLQMFYVPYEPFSHHYAFVPWLFYANLGYLFYKDKKSLLILVLVNILAIPQGYVPTIFLVYFMSLSIVFCIHLLFSRRIKSIFIAYIILLLVNFYWLLPNIYFALNKSQINVGAKLNHMSTEDNFLNSKKFGNLANTLLLKGFWFDNVELDKDGILHYQLEDWKKYMDSKSISIIGYSLFALAIVGIYYSFRKKIINALYFVPVLFFTFTLLSNETPVFSNLADLFYKIPIFSQIFRFPFTKFSILTAFCLSLFYAIAFIVITTETRKKILRYFTAIVFCITPVIFLFPILTGHLFYDKNRTKIPSEYFQINNFFQHKNSNGRIANFPQNSFWGWTFYKWNYSGSGFLWYGIEQPIMDRAFDVWSSEGENYYWEISQTVYSGNQEVFEKLLDKYQISWLLVDDNVISFSSQKEIYFNKLDKMIGNSQKITPAAVFGKIRIYRVLLTLEPKNFVFLSNSLVNIGPEYKWNNYDKGYEEYGNYISDNKEPSFAYGSTGVKTLADKSAGKQITSNRQSFDTERSRSAQGKQIADYNETIKQSSSDNLLSGRAGFFVESDIDKKNNNKSQTESNSGISIDIPKVSFIHDSNFPSILADNIKHTIPNTRSTVNTNKLDISNREPKLGAINTAPNQPEARLINRDENTLNHGFGIVKPIYAKDTQSTINNQQLMIPDIYYPFRSLFTGRRQEDLEFGVEDSLLRQGFGGQEGAYFSFKTKIPKSLEGAKLVIPKFGNEIFNVGEINLDNIVSKDPQVFLDGELIQIPPPLHLAGVMASQVQPATPEVKINSEVSLTLTYIKEGNLEVRVPKVGGLYSYDSNITYDVFENVPKTCDQFNKGIFTQETVVENETKLLKLTSVGSSNCLDIDLGHLAQRYGYLVSVENRNIEGKSLLISVINKNSQRADIETYLPKNNEPKEVQPPGRLNLPRTSYFVIPPMEPDAIGYTLHFDNTSIGRVKTVNYLGKITVNPIPYKFLTSLKIVTDSSTFKGETLKGDIKVDHPNPSFYKVDLASDSTLTPNTYMVLSQSFDKGWKAYEVQSSKFKVQNLMISIFPFIYGKEIKNHVLINNWENGWDLSSTSYNLQPVTIIIVYLPQYLEYLGFALLIIFLGFLFLTREKKYFHGIKIEPIVN